MSRIFSLPASDPYVIADGNGSLIAINPSNVNVVALPAISFVTSSITDVEGNSGTKNFVFTLTRTIPLTGTSTVDWAVSGSGINPANAADFVGGVFPSGTVTFNPGDTTKNIPVPVAGDAIAENDEAFAVTLSNPVGANLGSPSIAIGVITNDDLPDGYDVFGATTDSYGVGIIDRDNVLDTDWPGAFQYSIDSTRADYHTISSDITPLGVVNGQGNTATNGGHSYLSFLEYFAKTYYANTGRKCLIVPYCWNGHIFLGGFRPGESDHEAAVPHFNSAITAALAALSGSRFMGVIQWLGANDINAQAPATYSRAAEAAGMQAAIADFRTRITGASGAKLLLAGMIPEYYGKSGPGWQVELGIRDVLRDNSNVIYAQMPLGNIHSDQLHPTLAGQRYMGAQLANVLADTAAPVITAPTSRTVYQGNPLRVVLQSDKPCVWKVTGPNAASFEIFEEYYQWANGTSTFNSFKYVLRFAGNGGAPAPSSQTVTVVAKAGNGLTSQQDITANGIPAYGSTTATGAVTATLSQDIVQLGSVFTDNAGTPASFNLNFGAGLNLIYIEQAFTNNLLAIKVNGVSAVKIDPNANNAQTQVWAVTLAQAGNWQIDVFNAGGQNFANPNFAVVTLTNSKATYSGTPESIVTPVSTQGTSGSQTILTNGLIVSMGRGVNGDTLTNPSTFLKAPGANKFFVALRTTSGTIQLNGGGQARSLNTFAFDPAP